MTFDVTAGFRHNGDIVVDRLNAVAETLLERLLEPFFQRLITQAKSTSSVVSTMTNCDTCLTSQQHAAIQKQKP
jgi:hypothetical protein